MTNSVTPLPDEVQTARDSLQNYFDDTVGEYCGLMDDLQTLDAHITAQAEEIKRLREISASMIRGLREFFPSIDLAQNIADTADAALKEASK